MIEKKYCENCDKVFERKKQNYTVDRGKYCSNECKFIAQRKKRLKERVFA
mgnify:FL=1